MFYGRFVPAVTACAIALTALAPHLHAEEFPSRPVRFVVPYAPGGSTDTLARTISTALTGLLGQQVVVDNRPGANGDIGMSLVAKAPADGHTIVLGYIANLAINPNITTKTPYDPHKDFSAVTQVAAAPNILVTHPSLPAKNLQELITYGKAHPKTLTYASAGVGSIGHLTGALIALQSGIDMTHVPYKGSGQAVSDLVGGHVKIMISGMSSTLTHVRSGKLIGLATTGAKRTSATPSIPTIAESGFPGFSANAWYGVLAPAGTPKGPVTRLNRDIRKALEDAAVVKRLDGVGFEIISGSPEAFAAYMRAETRRWGEVVKAARVRAD
jgi:tripartite-type tricarboxylate transporter receptor subunit TctC